MARLMTRRFLRTLPPSMADRGVELWISSLAASRVKTCRLPESRKESTESEAACGLSTQGSFAKLNPNGSWSKMSPQCSLFPRAMPYSENLPKAGSMRSGFLFEQPTLVLRTDESASSSSRTGQWPTARAEDSECCGNHPGAQDSLGGATKDMMAYQKTWPTPVVVNRERDDESLENCRAIRKERAGQNTVPLYLGEVASRWKTPHGMANIDASGKHGGAGGGEFAKQANAWTTPQAHDSGGGNPDRVRRKGTEHGCANLADDVTKWTA